jgi:hypothetical protein
MRRDKYLKGEKTNKEQARRKAIAAQLQGLADRLGQGEDYDKLRKEIDRWKNEPK